MRGREFRRQRAEATYNLPNKRVILLDAVSIAEDDNAAVILNQEVLQAQGYQSQEYIYTPNTATFNITSQKLIAPDVTVSFISDISGLGYQATHAVLWVGRGAMSQKAIAVVNASSNQIICTNHGLIDGDRAFVRAVGTLPGGLTTQRYWAKKLDNDVVEFHANPSLTSPIDILSAGTGDMYLVHANGEMAQAQEYPLIVMTPGATKSFTVSWRM
jgi:hypothetical protein